MNTLKPRFFYLCGRFHIDAIGLQDIAHKANVHNFVVNAMFLNDRVSDAEKVLTAFSERTNTTYTLDNVQVSLLPTFKEIYERHHFDLATLSTGSSIPSAIIDMMLVDEPVPIQEARLVLQMASRLSRQNYSLETVDVRCSHD